MTTSTRTPAQADQILEWLEHGHSITTVEALNRFGCFRLAARIHDLRKRGIDIREQDITKNGVRFASYSLNERRAA